MEVFDQKLPHINVEIGETGINGGALKILEIIRPDWLQNEIVFKLLTDGITNKLVACNIKGANERETVLVRVYGNKTDLLIDRKAETRNIILLNKVGLAPRLFATFSNGLAYEYVPGCTLTEKSVLQPEIYTLVAKKMARLHKVQVEDKANNTPMLWDKLQKFFQLVPDRFSQEINHKRFQEIIMPKIQIQQEINFLKKYLSKLNSPAVFSHNDLLLANVIHTEENGSVTFIDFEYAAINYQAYDIGNHFMEFVGIDNIDYSKYPGEKYQKCWLTAYLKEYRQADEITQAEIDIMYKIVNKFGLATHIFWGLWALIQAEHSFIQFDFMGYAAIRFNEYLRKKCYFLNKSSQLI